MDSYEMKDVIFFFYFEDIFIFAVGLNTFEFDEQH